MGKRLRIESDPSKRRRNLVLKSAHDDDAAYNTVEFIGIQSCILGGTFRTWPDARPKSAIKPIAVWAMPCRSNE